MYYSDEHRFLEAVSWFVWSIVNLSWRSPGFDPGPVRVRFMVDKAALGVSRFFRYRLRTIAF